MSLQEMFLGEIGKGLKLGETVLFERTGDEEITLDLYYTIEWARKAGFRVLIVDVLDSYPTLVAKAKLSGLDTASFQDLDVIKIGCGRRKGNVIACIREVSEPVILIKKFTERYNSFLNAGTATIVVGVEKLFTILDMSPIEAQTIISNVANYVGDTRRLGAYLVKRDLLPKNKEFLLKLLEDIATTVVRIEKRGCLTEFYVVKSLNKKLEGALLRV